MAARRIEVADAQFAPVAPAAWAAVLWLGAFGTLLGLAVGRVSAATLLVCGGPALLALGLCFTSRADREQYVMRLCVAALMLPILMLFWALDRAPGWQLVLLALGALAGFTGAIAWLASAMTRIAPAPGRSPLGAALLGERLADLARRLGVPARCDGAHRWQIDLSPMAAPGHAQRLLLDIDEARREVIVRERAGAAGARPRDADEASMRTPGEPAFDPARPDAQRVAYTSVQATQLTSARLARVQLVLDDARRIVQADHARPADEKDAVALFALLVTASGYAWRPRFFGGRRDAAAQGVPAKRSAGRQPDPTRPNA